MPISRLRNVLCPILFACVLVPAHAAVTLVASDQQSAANPAVKTLDFFAREVAQRTQGEIVVSLKIDGTAGSEADVLRAVREGRQAMARVSLALLDDLPAVRLASLPYLFRSNEHMWRILEGEFGRRLDSEMEQAGLVRLMYLNSAPRDFYCTRPIRSQADFKGLKVRVLSSHVFEDLIRNLGATPVAMPFNSVVDGFRSGKLDCADGGVINYTSAEHFKVAPYLMLDEHLLTPDILVMSRQVWDRLPPSRQQEIKAAAGSGSEFMSRLWKDQEAASMAVIRKAGVTVIPRSEMSMAGIESQAIKTYSDYVTHPGDLETVMKISTTR